MKHILLALVVNTVAIHLCAQEDNAIPSPEFMNQVYALSKDKQLQPLEKVVVQLKTKNKVVSAKQMYVIDGGGSPIKLSGQQTEFVVSSEGGFGMDPSSQFELQRFDSKKGSRECVTGNYGGMMNKSKDKENETQVSLSFKKVRDGVYAIVPDKPLEKGEYAFLNKTSMQASGMTMKMDAYAFSVD
jgi:hypothetical protein